jgi:vibriolysin
VNGAYAPLNDAHYFGSKVFDMYKTLYNVSPLKRKPLTLRVHYGRNYANAFFLGNSMTFGDGNAEEFFPMVSLAVVAHEMTHGLTHQTSNLIYEGMPGGLDESFADMGGKMADAFVKGFDKATFDWGLGGDILKKEGYVLRCINNPPCDKSSIDHVKNYYTGLDVHLSSGVFNKIFYLVSMALDEGIREAFDVFYVANTRYWSRYTNFYEAAELTLKAVDHLKKGMHIKRDYSKLNPQVFADAFAQAGIKCTGKADKWKCTK